MTHPLRLIALVIASLFIFPSVLTGATLMLTEPAVSKDHVAFAYANDLWICDIDGSYPRRLTSATGAELFPVFSPDGKWLAFSADYEGNLDVYLVPVTGGTLTRLTFHPMNDTAVAFTPDGQAVVFSSPRDALVRTREALYTVPVTGGFPEQLPMPYGFNGSYSLDGKQMAFCPRPDNYIPWKHYRGGTHREIWLIDLADLAYEKIPQPEARCNDLEPWWNADGVYFMSDRNGEFNLFRYDTDTKNITALTDFSDFPVIHLAGCGNRIIFEQAGRLHLMDTTSGTHSPIDITVRTDKPATRPRYCSDAKYIRSTWLSPNGKRLAVDFRGEIVTVPAKKGDPRNISQSPGSHERFPCWSPDGQYLACFSDAGGEYNLCLYPAGGGKERRYPLDGSGFYAFPRWSPDAKKICFVDNGRGLYILDIATGAVTKVGQQPRYFPGTYEDLQANWSPDSKYIAYVLRSEADFNQAYIYSLASGKNVAITDGLSDVAQPTFDNNGKYLYLLASTNAGPRNHWFAMSNEENQLTYSLYLMVLPADAPSPLAKESDEEQGAKKQDAEEGKQTKETDTITDIDLKGLAQRIVPLPLPEALYGYLSVAGPGNIYYLEFPPHAQGGAGKLHHYNLDAKEDKVVCENVPYYQIAHDNAHIHYVMNNRHHITTLQALKPGNGVLDMAAIRVKVEPVKEWRQIFNEVWRIQRDYFYDPGMHGLNWQAVYDKYQPFLDHVACRQDLNRLMQWMISEMVVGHHWVGGGDTRQDTASVPVGLLGADYTIDQGRYRFKRIYGGLNWNPDLRSPLVQPGINVEEGDYLLAVNGAEVTADDNLFAFFTQTANRLVSITVAKTAAGEDKRTVQVEPVAFEAFLRNRFWVEDNLRKVTEATNGRVAYVYVPNTAHMGYTYFKRYFYPQCDREAIILDERFNGGGSFADYYLNTLNQPYLCSWTTRYGEPYKSPSASIQGPKVLLINEYAGSGGDLLPFAFRKLGIGPLIGKRTWGGLVGVLGFPLLIDGGYTSAPNLAVWTPEDGYFIENEGIAPDPGMEVEQDPAAVVRGEDPQLEKAIEVIMQQLPKEPPAPRTPPPFPKRAQ